MGHIGRSVSLAAILGTSTSALAQDAIDDATQEPTDDAATTSSDELGPASAAADAESAPDEGETGPDGGRFRFGVAGGVGPLSGAGVGFTYFGVDLRFGAQLNDALAIYAQPQLGYYKLNGADALFGSGGLVGTSVLAEYTLFDRLFMGAGFGYAVLNSPSGLELHLRAGGYPLMSKSTDAARRKGLMLGVDFRLHFVDGHTFVAPTFNLGYEAF